MRCRSQSEGNHSALEKPVSLHSPGDISPFPKAKPAPKVSETSTTSTLKALSFEQVSGTSTVRHYVSAWCSPSWGHPVPFAHPLCPTHISLHRSHVPHQTSCDEIYEFLPHPTLLSMVLASVMLLDEPGIVLPLTQAPAQPLIPFSWALR